MLAQSIDGAYSRRASFTPAGTVASIFEPPGLSMSNVRLPRGVATGLDDADK
jgi:hypothetical protein